MRQRALLRSLGALCIGVLVCAGCSGGGNSPSGAATNQTPGSTSGQNTPSGPKTLNVAAAAFPANLSPGHSGNPSLSLLLQFMDGLTKKNAKGQPEPNLAESWSIVNDTTWEFKLRKDVKFHNGEPFNAQAVKFTFDRLLDAKRPYARRGRVGLVTSVEVVDDYTVRMITSAPFPLLPIGLRDIVIEPPQYIQQNGEETWLKKPIGTGAFTVVQWEPNSHLSLEANPDYFGGKPGVDKLMIRNIVEPATRVSALKAGELQIAEQIPIDLVPEINTGDTQVVQVPVDMGLVITYNLQQDGPLKKLQVRQAIDYAIDRTALFKGILQGNGAVLDGQLITKGAVGYNPNLKPTPYDPEKARKLLAEAGYPNGLTITLNSPTGKYLADKDIAVAVADQLKKVGIQVKLNIMEWGAFSAANDKLQLPDMHIIGWFNNGDADFALIWYSTGSKRSYWQDKTFDDLFLKARTTIDKAARDKVLFEASERMNRELPSSFLVQLPAVYGVSKKVSGWAPRSDEMLFLQTATVK